MNQNKVVGSHTGCCSTKAPSPKLDHFPHSHHPTFARFTHPGPFPFPTTGTPPIASSGLFLLHCSYTTNDIIHFHLYFPFYLRPILFRTLYDDTIHPWCDHHRLWGLLFGVKIKTKTEKNVAQNMNTFAAAQTNVQWKRAGHKHHSGFIGCVQRGVSSSIQHTCATPQWIFCQPAARYLRWGNR